MGWGDFGSNGSVHWSIGYEGKQGKTKDKADHKDFDDEVKHPDRLGTDPRPKIGGSGGRNHEGSFLVTLRFTTEKQMTDALGAVVKQKKNNGQQDWYEASIEVPTRPWDDVKSGPGDHDRWEVTVEW